MNILNEIKKQVDIEMKKIKKVPVSKKTIPSQQKKELVDMVNQGVLLKDAAKKLNLNYHEAKVAYNEQKRKSMSTQSETESAVYSVRTAGVTALKWFPRHFLLQQSVNNNLVSVRRLYNVLVLNPKQQ
ncbi:unnamed protein product (macronuclear) [Paramecium tetraurelia]|uniref:HTH psq-type domain-containing protein n=1 Tax=Paramecium tetraurelia TaxID=5888 RepID=A0E6W6_PARTE|nr:uncharacterized protein GSPATT00023761001 [Paramecium tetraurelia]CAK91033.1 unnamed protein product [Paramecium tetraurelia]|eukprot:XP_001458430.1 hypothetical protein (macronuclear) [Paramecium tetraurelia strain d4-2]